MHGQQRLDCLQLHDDTLFNHQVQKLRSKPLASMFDHDSLLTLKPQPAMFELYPQRILIQTFAQSRSELFVNLDRCADNPLDNLFNFER